MSCRLEHEVLVEIECHPEINTAHLHKDDK